MKTKLYDVLGTMFEINDVSYKKNAKFESALLFSNAKAFIFIVDLTHFDQTVQGEKKRKNKMVSNLSLTYSTHPFHGTQIMQLLTIYYIYAALYEFFNEYYITILNAG